MPVGGGDIGGQACRRIDPDEAGPARHRSGFSPRETARRSARAAPRRPLRARENVGQLAGHGEGVEIGAGIDRLRLPKRRVSLSRPCHSGVAIVAAATMRPSSARVDLQMRAADIEAGDDVLSFFHASSFHDRGGRVAGKSVAYHSCSRLERRRGGPRRKGAARQLPADRHAAQRKLRPGRRRRRPADALSIPDLLHRRSGRYRRPCAERGGARAAESHAGSARTLGGRRSRRRKALRGALRTAAPPVLGSESQRDDALLRQFWVLLACEVELQMFAPGHIAPITSDSTGHIAPTNKARMHEFSPASRTILDFGLTSDARCRGNDCNSLTHNGQTAH